MPPPSRPRRLLGVVLLLALVLAGCGTSTSVRRPGSADGSGNPLARLSEAIAATNTTRAAVLTALANADAAVGEADSADQDALAGNRSAAGPIVPRAVAAVHTAVSASAGTQAAATAYTAALTELAGATRTAPLSVAQTQAVVAVVTAGRREASALRASADAYARALPTYDAVVGVQQTWYAHANAGWFATPQEAGGAYQIARLPYAQQLQQAQAALAAADTGRQTASAPMQAALAQARTALATLS